MRPLRLLALFSTSLSLLASACYAPQIAPGAQQCSDDKQCAEGLKCFPDNHCYPPNADPDCRDKCTGQTPVCDKATLKCVGCLTDTNCPAGYICATNVKVCKPGCSAKHPGCADDAGSCDVDLGVCRGCLTDDECGDPALPRCDVGNGRCVACLTTNDNCPADQYCDDSNGRFNCTAGCKSKASCAAPDGGGQIECCKHACVDMQSDLENCGACGMACPMGNACCAGGCVDPKSDANNCGGCGVVCAPQNVMGAVCNAGACEFTACARGFADCDGNRANGCETNTLADAKNCGACKMACPSFPNAGAACMNGACGPICSMGFANCDGQAANGCETATGSDVKNCGACGKACAFANAAASCVSGTCALGACNTGFANCDMLPANGCETSTVTDARNCGGCNRVCSFPNAAASCVNSNCAVGACNAGFGNCNMLPADGCETPLAVDVKNCGACGSACSFANAGASCANSACVLGACSANFGNCDAVPANGCETNFLTDAKNCGGCGKACGANQACTNGACTCAPNFADCNGSALDGCEVNTLTNASHCGGCGRACGAVANGTPGCAAGVCGVGTCNTNWGNCDGSAANGCESNLNFDAKNCTACGKACAAGQTCTKGTCAVATPLKAAGTYGPQHTFAGLTTDHYITQGGCSINGNVDADDAWYFCTHFYGPNCYVQAGFVKQTTPAATYGKMHKQGGCTTLGNDIPNTTCEASASTNCKIGNWSEITSGLANLICRCQ